MDWDEVVDAVDEIDVGSCEDLHGVSSSGGSTLTSFEMLGSTTSKTSSYNMADDPEGESDGDSGEAGAYTAHTMESTVIALHTFAAGRTTAFLDSGSTDHCFSRRELFADYTALPDREGTGVEGSKFRILGTGTICQSVELGGTKRVLTFEALHTPSTSNLISVSKLDERGYKVEFSTGKAIVRAPGGEAILEAKLVAGMYVIVLEDVGVTANVARSRDVPVSRNTWHRRLGHVGMTGLDLIVKGDHVNGLTITGTEDDGLCEDCLSGKQSRRPFDGEHEPEKEAGECTYMDLWGPAQTTGVGGKNWLMHLLDGHVAGPRVDFLAQKSADEALDSFATYKAEFETQTGKKLKRLRVDNGREWINKKFEAYLLENGIVLEPTIPYSSAQNGPGERGIRTTVELGRCLLADSGLPKSFWPFAFKAAAYLQWFHSKTRTGGVTPWEVYYQLSS
jgi:hypothetical protein